MIAGEGLLVTEHVTQGATTPQAPPMLAMQREIAMIQASSDQKSKVFVAKTHFPLLNLETDQVLAHQLTKSTIFSKVF